MHPLLTLLSKPGSVARGAAVLIVSAAALAAGTCSGCLVKKPVEQHYYDEHIQPIFNNFCINNTSPCHRVDPTTGVALGNLDLTSFDNVQKRRDVLRVYGSYPTALLLLKAEPDPEVTIRFQGKAYKSEILHSGGKPISASSDAAQELTNWLTNGANRDGILPVGGPNTGLGNCASGDAAVPANWVAPVIDTTSSAYTTFQSTLFPTIAGSCAFGTCHSSPQSDFYMTCGDTPRNQLYNYARAASFVTPAPATPLDPPTVDGSEILLRPLSVAGGGINHTGGEFFQNRNDTTWKQWELWALDVQMHPLPAAAKSTGRAFFEANVLPKLIQRGCALEGCHSPDGFNDFRLRPGAQGFLSDGAITRDYDTLLTEFMALDSVDVRQSRAVKKTTNAGITHRGGSLLEDTGVTSDVPCPTPFPAGLPAGPTTPAYDPKLPYDATNAATARAYCVLQEWHRLERADRAAAVSPMAKGDVLPLVFVSRPPNADTLLQFDTYEGMADLKLADATMGDPAVAQGGLVTGVANVRSALTPCAGLAGKDVDVRGPEWSYDGSKIIFAARPGAASGLDLWLLDVAGGTCKQLTSDNGRVVNGVRVHNFDPAFAPDGSVVFASTRAGTVTLKTFLPNSDLFRVGPSLDFSNPQQMTFLLNSELGPAFMQDGRVSFTAEKATPDFYQLSGRRINWDLTDYHPLLAQRAQSTDTFSTTEHPSVGYQQATEIREGLDRNFLIILSDATARGGGGALATFNRSIGPFEADRTEVTFLKSLVIVDQAATAHAGTAGVYRSPFSLPNGEILASYAANVTDPTTQTPKYDLVAVGPTGARRALVNDPTLSYVEAALGYKRAETQLFTNLPQLVFGGHNEGGGMATMHFPDLPLLATLLGANLRHGRNVAEFDGAAVLHAFAEKAPPAGTTPANPPAGLMGAQQVYSNRMSLGTAPLQADHSLKVYMPAATPLILELDDAKGAALFTMSEEHQVTAGEYITPGAPRALFNGICAGCHGSISGQELDIAVTSDTLTGASVSMSRDANPASLQ
jgi:WD40 repeat protein